MVFGLCYGEWGRSFEELVEVCAAEHNFGALSAEGVEQTSAASALCQVRVVCLFSSLHLL